MIDKEEFDYWYSQFPELDKQDIIDILEYVEEEINTEKDD